MSNGYIRFFERWHIATITIASIRFLLILFLNRPFLASKRDAVVIDPSEGDR